MRARLLAAYTRTTLHRKVEAVVDRRPGYCCSGASAIKCCYAALFFIHLATRRVHVAGITPHPNEQWMTQVARNVTMADVGFVSSSRYLIHDRDSKFCKSFQRTIEAVGVAPVKLPARDE